MSNLDVIESHFFIHGKSVSRYRDTKTGRFVKAPVKEPIFIYKPLTEEEEEEPEYRVSVAITGVVKRGKYRDFEAHDIVPESEVEATKDGLIDDVLRQIEDWVGYPQDEWWFSVGEEVREISSEPV